MKKIALLTGLGFAAFAHGSDAWEQALNQAISPYRFASTVSYHLEGTDWINNAYATVQSDLHYSIRTDGAKPVAQFQLVTYLNGRMSDRIVGDGTTVYVYNCRTYEYSATRYGTYNGGVSANYLRDMILIATGAARGSAAYPARLFRETFSGDNVEYRSWAPGATPTAISNGQPTADPILSSRVYNPSPTEQVWLFTSSGRRSFAFTVDVSSGYDLRKIEFHEAMKQAASLRSSEWTMTLYRDLAIDPSNFMPYAATQLKGWRVVPGTRPGG